MKRLLPLIVVLLFAGAVLAVDLTLKQQIQQNVDELDQLAEGLPGNHKQAMIDKIAALRVLVDQLPDEPVPDPDDPVEPDPDDPVEPDPDEPDDPVDPDGPVDPDPDPIDPDIPLGEPHADFVPDFTVDPDAIVIASGDTLEIDSTVEFTTLVINDGATLNLLPGAELVVMDTPINTDLDPTQIGHGVINLGTWNYAGTPKTEFARSTTGIPQGTETITLDVAPEGWNVGDVLVLPDTRQHVIGTRPESWTERVTVTSIDGATVTITPTQHDHLTGTHEWMTPHVANVTRDIVIRSENPAGVRGHVIHMGKARVNGSHAAFVGLGRTDATRLHNSTLFDEDGNVTHIGTNQNGRYVNHFHKIRGYGQFVQLKGDVYDGSRKWCLAVHGAQGLTAERCIGIDAVGGTFTTEDGDEEHNTFRECIAIGARNGLGGRRPQPLQTNTVFDIARDGSGFWFRNVGNNVIDCIAADCEERGFAFNGMAMGTFALPRKENPGTFTGNEAYTTREAYWFREHQGGVNNAQHSQFIRFPIIDCTAWSVEEVGVLLYRTAAVTIDNVRVYSDPRIGEQARGRDDLLFNNVLDRCSIGFVLGIADYASTSQVLTNSRCEGFSVGVHMPPKPWVDMRGLHDPASYVTSTVLNAGIPIVFPIVHNETPYLLDDVLLERIDMTAVPPLPAEPTDVWMNSTAGSLRWPIGDPHNIWVNGERYWYAEQAGEGREEREGVIGLVSQE